MYDSNLWFVIALIQSKMGTLLLSNQHFDGLMFGWIRCLSGRLYVFFKPEQSSGYGDLAGLMVKDTYKIPWLVVILSNLMECPGRLISNDFYIWICWGGHVRISCPKSFDVGSNCNVQPLDEVQPKERLLELWKHEFSFFSQKYWKCF